MYVAREKGHDRANRFAVILRQTRPLMGSPTFQPVLLKLVGSDEEVAIAREIQKAVKQAPGVWPRAPSAPPGPGAPRQLSSVVCSIAAAGAILLDHVGGHKTPANSVKEKECNVF